MARAVRGNRRLFSGALVLLLTTGLLTPQVPINKHIVSITANKEPLSQVLNELSIQTGLNISYSEKTVPSNLLTTCQYTNTEVSVVLNDILSEHGLHYTKLHKQLIIRKTVPAEKYVVYGYVKDALNNEVLVGANIYNSLSDGVISNEYGYYSLKVSNKDSSIHTLFMGYKPFTCNLVFNNNQRFDIYLKPDTSLIKEILVSASDMQMLENAQSGQHVIKSAFVENMATHIGESDMLKSLGSLPGIQLYADGSVNFHVRGGMRDQNLILVDDAQIYNPSHLFGFYSALIPEAIQYMDIYKTDIPPQFGGILSSVVDIKLKEGNKNHFSAGITTGLVSTRYRLEGPVFNNKSSYFITFRNSHLKPIAQHYLPELNNVYFNDVYAKVSLRLNPDNRLFLSFLTANDELFIQSSDSSETAGFKWNNSMLNIRWNHLYNTRVFSNTSFILSSYEYSHYVSKEDDAYWLSHINNIKLKHNLHYIASPSFNIKFGSQLEFYSFDPGNYYQRTETTLNNPVVPKHYATHLSAYVSIKQKLSKSLHLRYGLRYNNWNNVGEAIVFDYNNQAAPVDTTHIPVNKVYNSTHHFAPRFTASYTFNQQNSIKFNYSNTFQYVHIISNSISPFNSFEVWLPSNKHIPPQWAHNLSLAYYRKYPSIKSLFTTELYFRKLKNQIEYQYHPKLFLNPHLEQELIFGDIISYGAEVSLVKNIGKLNGQLAYSYSRVTCNTKGINNNKKYPALYEKPHEFSILAAFKTTRRILVSAGWSIQSGRRFSAPGQFIIYNNYQVPVYNSKNNSRFPAYHRLDLAASFKLNKIPQKFNHTLKLSVYNAYIHQNPVSINFNKTIAGNNNIYIPVNRVAMPFQVVTKTYLLSFFPSVNYTLSFR